MLRPRETATNFGSCFRIIHALPKKTIAAIVFRVLNSSVLSLVVDGKSAGLFRANLAFL
jgi:hypothetical protein